jgi:hypothetical protein
MASHQTQPTAPVHLRRPVAPEQAAEGQRQQAVGRQAKARQGCYDRAQQAQQSGPSSGSQGQQPRPGACRLLGFLLRLLLPLGLLLCRGQ